MKEVTHVYCLSLNTREITKCPPRPSVCIKLTCVYYFTLFFSQFILSVVWIHNFVCLCKLNHGLCILFWSISKHCGCPRDLLMGNSTLWVPGRVYQSGGVRARASECIRQEPDSRAHRRSVTLPSATRYCSTAGSSPCVCLTVWHESRS